MKVPALFATVCAAMLVVAAADAATTVTVRDSRLTFNQALAACPTALGSVTFSLSHTRVAGHTGVYEETDSISPGVDTVTLVRDADKATSTVVTNGHNRTVTGNHVTLQSNGRVACVMPG